MITTPQENIMSLVPASSNSVTDEPHLPVPTEDLYLIVKYGSVVEDSTDTPG